MSADEETMSVADIDKALDLAKERIRSALTDLQAFIGHDWLIDVEIEWADVSTCERRPLVAVARVEVNAKRSSQ